MRFLETTIISNYLNLKPDNFESVVSRLDESYKYYNRVCIANGNDTSICKLRFNNMIKECKGFDDFVKSEIRD